MFNVLSFDEILAGLRDTYLIEAFGTAEAMSETSGASVFGLHYLHIYCESYIAGRKRRQHQRASLDNNRLESSRVQIVQVFRVDEMNIIC